MRRSMRVLFPLLIVACGCASHPRPIPLKLVGGPSVLPQFFMEVVCVVEEGTCDDQTGVWQYSSLVLKENLPEELRQYVGPPRFFGIEDGVVWGLTGDLRKGDVVILTLYMDGYFAARRKAAEQSPAPEH